MWGRNWRLVSANDGSREKALKNCTSETGSWRPVIRSMESGSPKWKSRERGLQPGVVGATIQGGRARRDEVTHEDTRVFQDHAGGDGRRIFCLQWERAASNYDGRRHQGGCADSPYMYGFFTELHEANNEGGCWAEMLGDRKFFHPVDSSKEPEAAPGRRRRATAPVQAPGPGRVRSDRPAKGLRGRAQPHGEAGGRHAAWHPSGGPGTPQREEVLRPRDSGGRRGGGRKVSWSGGPIRATGSPSP